MDELIEKALTIKKDENSELEKLLEDAGFAIAPLLVELINNVQDSVDDVLQDDLEELLLITSELLAQNLTVPSNRKIKRALNKRSFTVSFKQKVNPELVKAVNETGKEFSKIYGTDFSYDDLTKRTSKELNKWFNELPKTMKLSTDHNVSNLVKKAYEEGKGIRWLEKELSKSSAFTFARARTTAITETLTMQSYGSFENIMQTKSVTKSRWRHSFGIKEPRSNHEALDGEEVDKGTEFDLGGVTCLYPRQPKLPPEERIRCHCWVEPVVDKEYTDNDDDDDDYYEEEE